MIELKNVSAVLITKEDRYPQAVLDSLPDFREVLIHTRCVGMWYRWQFASLASSPHVYVQDDDCIVDPKHLIEEHYDGVKLTNYVKLQSEDWYQDVSGGTVTLVGFGAVFPYRFLDNYFILRAKLPQDSLTDMHADRVFTYANRPHHGVVCDVLDLHSAGGKDRISMRPGHIPETLEIIRRLRELK